MGDKDLKAQVAGFFNKHCVPIHIQFQKDSEIHEYIYSAFLISIDEDWFLITAGHCMNEIAKIKKLGYKAVTVNLIDNVGYQSKYDFPIPFDYDGSTKYCIDLDGYDYGIIYIEPHYQKLLLANDVAPFNEQTWAYQPDNPDFYFLLGVPGELTEIMDSEIKFVLPILKVKECESTPSIFKKTSAPTFYGEVELEGENIKSIKGMSGGPILSFKITENEGLKYWLCGVQSRWFQHEKLIAACRTTPLVTRLKEALNK